MDVYSLPSL
jgi:hypothetical protein